MVKFIAIAFVIFASFILVVHPYYSCTYTPPSDYSNKRLTESVSSDSDGNGFPDALDLFDREDCFRFRTWFVSIAVSQYYKLSRYWDESNRDCAGLVRFSFIEALKRHTDSWFKKQEFIICPDVGDVKKYNYPDVPIVGVNVFKVGDRKFGSFADASVLLSFDLRFVSKDLKDARPGDILAFCHPEREEPYHLMIYAGRIGERDFLVYHTGSNVKGMRLISVDNLKSHPDVSWHPVKENRDFLGVFSWRILH